MSRVQDLAARLRLWAALIPLLPVLSVAVSLADPRSSAEQKFYPLTNNTKMGVNFDLLPDSGLTPAGKARREQEATELFKPTCVKTYTETLQASVSSAAERANERSD